MITQARSERMVVFSDLHMGNPFSSVRAKTVAFIEWASREGFDICINGDGFDVAQASLRCFTADAPEVLQSLKNAVARGRKVFYVVGNHDILFEHFLSDWGGLMLSPFLNLQSGNARIRVEHGHLYDPFFVSMPRLYEFSTWLAGFALKLHPALYRAWIRFERFKGRLIRTTHGGMGIIGEPASFYGAASGIEARGFDGVIFGHTHHPGSAALPYGGRYVNPGSWMLNSKFVQIENGKIELKDFLKISGEKKDARFAG